MINLPLKETILAASVTLLATSIACAADQKVIRIGYLPQAHDGPLMAAEKTLGANYTVEYVKFFRYADAEIALANGDIDFSSLGYVSAITAASRGGVPKFKFVAGQSRGAINLVCRNDVKINEWQDLKGRIFGVLTGGPGEIFFDQALAMHGVAGADIKKVSFAVPGPPILQSLQERLIDCTAVYEPFAASIVADGRGYYPQIDLADNPFGGINGGIAVNASFLEANKPIVEKLVLSSIAASEAFPKDKQTWIETVVAKTGVSVKTATVGVDHVVLDWELYPERVSVLAAHVAGIGMIKQVPTREAIARYFDLSFTLDVKRPK